MSTNFDKYVQARLRLNDFVSLFKGAKCGEYVKWLDSVDLSVRFSGDIPFLYCTSIFLKNSVYFFRFEFFNGVFTIVCRIFDFVKTE